MLKRENETQHVTLLILCTALKCEKLQSNETKRHCHNNNKIDYNLEVVITRLQIPNRSTEAT